jgi:DNA-directed RNA polymerase specialized sigma24 family protein
MIDPDLVRRAAEADRDSLESLIQQTQHRIYGLALRMLWNPEDARDATQEILLRMITNLSTYRYESSFLTGSLASRAIVC